MKFLPLVIAGLAIAMPKTHTDSEMTIAAKEFLDSLSKEQRSKAVFPFDSEERYKWNYVPMDRKGIAWNEMTAIQRNAATALLKSALSNEGFRKVQAIRELENVLREMENGNTGRDPERYWFVFFGEPSSANSWVWRYEGHHVSLTFGSKDGVIDSSTPQFLGSNPAEVKSGPKVGTRILKEEQDMAYKFVEMLNADQIRKAVISKDAPNEIATASSRKAAIENRSGIMYTDLEGPQKAALMNLVATHARVQTPEEQKRRLSQFGKGKMGNIVFAWMGSTLRGQRHYYRIMGDSFIIEYDNTQNDANHIHTVWRDRKEDFGGDALAEHYAHSHHHDHSDGHEHKH